MGLAETIRDALKVAFIAVDNISESVTFRRPGTKTYDTATGAVTEGDLIEITLPRAVFTTNVSKLRPDSGLIPESIRMIVEVAPFQGVSPRVHDYIVRGDGSTFEVIASDLLPAETAWECRLRRAT